MSGNNDIPFYERNIEERIALTEAAIRDRRTLMERWSVLAEAEGAHWNARSALAADLLHDQPSVTEFGCGMMYLEKYMRAEQIYCPSDVVARDCRTLICDLNIDNVPNTNTVAAAMLGVLEYIFDIKKILIQASNIFEVLVVTYCVSDAPEGPLERREHAWVNSFSTREIEEIFFYHGWRIECQQFVDSWQRIWKLKSQRVRT
jgi:hypothetical protein